MLQVGPGEANIWGTEVIYDSTTDITERDWGVTRAPQKTYYIYLKKDGQLWVDNIDPEFVATANGEYHPILNYRYIGKFFVSSAGRIVFYLSAHYNSPEVITVGADDYTGYANYYCDGVEDEVEINDAITYVTEGLGAGEVQLLGQNFYTNARITSSNGAWTLNGTGCSITGTLTTNKYVIHVTGGDGVTIKNMTLRDTYTGAVSSGVTHIWMQGTSDCTVDNVISESASQYGIVFGASAVAGGASQRAVVRNCWIKTPQGTHISSSQTEDILVENTILSGPDEYTEANSDGGAVYFSECERPVFRNNRVVNVISGTSYIMGIFGASTGARITGNVFRDCQTLGEAATAQVIHIQGSLGAVRACVVADNEFTNCKAIDGVAHTAETAINLASGGSGVTDTLVRNNTAYDNGNLVDRANCGSSTAPMIRGESSGGSSGCTFAMTNSVYYDGSASYGLTKTTTTLPGLVHLVSNTTSGLHGIVAGTTYGLRAWGYTTGAASASECFMFMRYTTAASNWTYGYISNTGTFCGFSLSVTIDATASQFSWGFGVATTAASGEVFNVDHIRLFPIGQHNEHAQQFVNSGTGTQESGNSWQCPFPA